jgi:hypothetical protein
MSPHNPKHEFSPKPSEDEKPIFAHMFKDLLPDVEFAESTEMLEARTAILEALTMNTRNPELLQSAWVEYAKICEQTVDDRTDNDPRVRNQLQIAVLIHKALIFREVGDMKRYGEDLVDAEEYAYSTGLDEIAEAIGAELDNLTS